jgi:GTP cyclohydrolase I
LQPLHSLAGEIRDLDEVASPAERYELRPAWMMVEGQHALDVNRHFARPGDEVVSRGWNFQRVCTWPCGTTNEECEGMTQELDYETPLALMRTIPTDPLETLARQLLLEIGEDPERDGLQETPARFARWWREFSNYDAGNVETLFSIEDKGQTVVISDVEVWSMCEHHLLPFSCSISMAYRPNGSILGLSKFARIAHRHAHRLQVQERLVREIADEIRSITSSEDVAVIGRGQHLCMSMRGIRTPALMTSSYCSGVFEQHGPERQELMTTYFGAQ